MVYIKRVTSKIILLLWSILFACSDYLSHSLIIHKISSLWPNNGWSLTHHCPVALRNWRRLFHRCAVKTTHASSSASVHGLLSWTVTLYVLPVLNWKWLWRKTNDFVMTFKTGIYMSAWDNITGFDMNRKWMICLSFNYLS